MEEWGVQHHFFTMLGIVISHLFARRKVNGWDTRRCRGSLEPTLAAKTKTRRGWGTRHPAKNNRRSFDSLCSLWMTELGGGLGKGRDLNKELRTRARRELDEDLRVFRGKRVRRSKWGWLRGVRQALGMRVDEVARRLNVGRSEVYRLEMSESRETITLKKLRAAAAAMGCEVVYAVVPRKGTLEELAEELERERKKHPTGRRKSLANSDPFRFTQMVETVLALTGWHAGKAGRRE